MDPQQECYQVGDLIIDVVRGRVTRYGREIDLGKLSFDLLVALVRAAPALVSVDALIGTVWADTVVGPETVSQRVKRLRAALADDPKSPRYIGGVRGRGYRVVATVERRASEQPVSYPDRPRATGYRKAGLIGVLLILLALGISFGWLHSRQPMEASASALYSQAGFVHISAPGLQQAMLLLNGAIAQDPDFARAFAARAQVRIGKAILGYAPPDVVEGAERDAQRALALEPNLDTANAVLGMVSAFHGDWPNADARFRAALATGDSSAAIHAEYATFVLASAGHLHRGLAEMDRAYQIAPTSQSIVALAAAMNSLAGRDADADRFARLARDLGYPVTSAPLAQVLAASAQRRGNFDEATRIAQTTLPAPIRTAGGAEALKVVYAALADPTLKPAARRALQGLLRNLDPGDIDIATGEELIAWFTQMDALDSAYEVAGNTVDHLARAGATGNTWSFLWGPQMRPFRRDRRFRDLVKRLKLADDWKLYGPPDSCSMTAGQLTCA
jgi:DNA-binding winged helix-turn-helix (wHTH) protein/Tfp pilus assembly protein PilF